MSSKPKPTPVYKVGDKVAMVSIEWSSSMRNGTERVDAVATVGARREEDPPCPTAPSSAIPAYSMRKGDWSGYGSTPRSSRIRPVQPGDEETVPLGEPRRKLERAQEVQRNRLLSRVDRVRCGGTSTRPPREKVIALVEPTLLAGGES